MARAGRSQLVYLDTHVLAWLHDGLLERLSSAAARAIEAGRLTLSGMAELELQYLHELGRLRPNAKEIVAALAEEIGLQRSEMPLAPIAAKACELGWTRDPFDRLISAEVLLAGARLVTKDETILANCEAALW